MKNYFNFLVICQVIGNYDLQALLQKYPSVEAINVITSDFLDTYTDSIMLVDKTTELSEDRTSLDQIRMELFANNDDEEDYAVGVYVTAGRDGSHIFFMECADPHKKAEFSKQIAEIIQALDEFAVSYQIESEADQPLQLMLVTEDDTDAETVRANFAEFIKDSRDCCQD